MRVSKPCCKGRWVIDPGFTWRLFILRFEQTPFSGSLCTISGPTRRKGDTSFSAIRYLKSQQQKGKGKKREDREWLGVMALILMAALLDPISDALLLLKTSSPTTDLDQTSLLTSQNWVSACISFQHVKGPSTLPDQCGAHCEQPISETGI